MPRYFKCKTPGIRYREHATRKHGIKPDRYYLIRYKLNGKDKEEALGWSSQGWTEQKAAEYRAEIKKAQRTGEGAKSLAEKRELVEQEKRARAKEEALKKAEEESRITFAQAAEQYMQWAVNNKKDHRHDELRLRLHILPELGKKLLQDIELAHIEALKAKCQNKGQSAATVRHILQIVRAVYNRARRIGLYGGSNPTREIQFPRPDNKRIQFFTYEQADALLSELWQRDVHAHDMTLVSLQAGLRFGEIARLRWNDLDMESGIIHVLDAKSGESRKAFMTEDLAAMFERRKETSKSTLVFPSRTGDVRRDIPPKFRRTIKDMGFNDGIEDSRQRYYFHTCRHTFGSWLAQQGTPILTIKELMGHKTLEMTMRYAHLSPDSKREAVEQLARRAKAGARGKVVPFRKTAGG